MTLRRALRLLERGRALSNVRFSDAQSSFYAWSSAFVIAFKNAKLSLGLHGFCACFRSDAHACAAMHADGAQRTQPLSFGGDLRAGTCFVDRNGPFGVYPYLFAHTMDLIRRIMPTLSTLNQQCTVFLNALGLHPIGQINPSEWLGTLISQGTGIIAKESMAFAAKAGQFVFSFVIAYYLLCERKRLGRHLLLLLPIARREIFLSACLGCKNALMSYLSGVLKTSLFVFLATFAGLFALGINDALLLSVFMSVFEVFPYIGPILASIPIALTALGQGIGQAISALIVVVIVQQIEGNFVTPYFTASSTSIRPFSALIGVFILGSLMGLWGIVLAHSAAGYFAQHILVAPQRHNYDETIIKR